MAKARASSLPWWQTSLLAALAAMGVTAAFLYIPPSRASIVLAVGAATFVILLLLNPTMWRRRLAAASVGTAAVGLAPEIDGLIDLGGLGVIKISAGGASLLAGSFIALAGLLAILEYAEGLGAFPHTPDNRQVEKKKPSGAFFAA